MSVTDLASPPSITRPARPRPWWRSTGAVLAGSAAVLLAGWWWASNPRLGYDGGTGVWSADHEIVRVTGPDSTMYVVPSDTAGETTLLFDLQNRGRLPVRIVDVWPDPTEGHGCLWSPHAREVADDPATMHTFEGPASPARGATIPAGGNLSVWITGSHPDPDGCRHVGITSTGTVDLVVSVAGRTSTVTVPLGYSFGYSDRPMEQTDGYGVEVLPRTGDLQRD